MKRPSSHSLPASTGTPARAAGLFVVCSFLACVGCEAPLRTPPSGPFPLNARFSIVEFPPPPALVQSLPEDPGPACAWVDGYYTWQGRRWIWVKGGWMKLTPGCYRTDSAMAWVPTDSGAILYYAEPSWYREGTQSNLGVPVRTSDECARPPKNKTDCRQP